MLYRTTIPPASAFRVPVEMIGRINELAERKRLPRSSIVEAAVASFLSPDALDQREAPLRAASIS